MKLMTLFDVFRAFNNIKLVDIVTNEEYEFTEDHLHDYIFEVEYGNKEGLNEKPYLIFKTGKVEIGEK